MAEEKDRDINELASQAKRSQTEDHIAALIVAMEPIVSASVRRVVVQPDAAEDIAQDVLLRLFTRLSSWDPNLGSFRTWAVAVARNAARDYLRQQQRGAETLQDDVPSDSPPYLAQIEDASLIRSAYEHLRARRDVSGRRVLSAARDLAYQGDDLSIAAIARQAELSESTARRALARVRRLIEKLEEN
jgi:RNA polymerase sigma factor (sigma-70 family)